MPDIRDFFVPRTTTTAKKKATKAATKGKRATKGKKAARGRPRPTEALGEVLKREMGGVRNVRMQLRSPGFEEVIKSDPERYLMWLYDAGVPSSLPGGVFPIRRILGHPARTLWQRRRESGALASEDGGGGDDDGKPAGRGRERGRAPKDGGPEFFAEHALTRERCRRVVVGGGATRRTECDPRPLLEALTSRGDSAAARKAVLRVVNDVFVNLGWWAQGGPRQLRWLCAVALEEELEMPHEHLAPAAVLAGRAAAAWRLRRAARPADLLEAAAEPGSLVVAQRAGRAGAQLVLRRRLVLACDLLANVRSLAASAPYHDLTCTAPRGLNAGQRAAFELVHRRRVALMTGPGGSGKTYALHAIIADGGFHHAAHFSPTHRVRKAALLAASPGMLGGPAGWSPGAAGAPPRLVCRTLHWALCGKPGATMLDAYLKSMEAATTSGTLLGGETVTVPVPAPPCLLVVEEASMASADQLAHVLRAAAARPNVHVCLVGDPNQLPPVKARGMPLTDLVAAGALPTARLEHNFRSAPGVQRFLAAMADRAAPRFNVVLAAGGGAVRLHKSCGRCDAAAKAAVALVRSHLAAGGRLWHEEDGPGGPARRRRSIMVVCPTNRLCGVIARELRPGRRSSREFAPGQAVLMTENTRAFKNGDAATVVAAPPGRTGDGRRALGAHDLEVRLRGREKPLVVKAMQVKAADAITVHGAQGAEADVVVVAAPLGEGQHMLDRRLLYTAMSRAKAELHLVGPRPHFSNTGRAGKRVDYATALEMLRLRDIADDPTENAAALLLCAEKMGRAAAADAGAPGGGLIAVPPAPVAALLQTARNVAAFLR